MSARKWRSAQESTPANAITSFISLMTDGAIKIYFKSGITSNNERARVLWDHYRIEYWSIRYEIALWFTAWLLSALNHFCMELEKTISYYYWRTTRAHCVTSTRLRIDDTFLFGELLWFSDLRGETWIINLFWVMGKMYSCIVLWIILYLSYFGNGHQFVDVSIILFVVW